MRTFYLIARELNGETQYATRRYVSREDFEGVLGWTHSSYDANWYESPEDARKAIGLSAEIRSASPTVVTYTKP